MERKMKLCSFLITIFLSCNVMAFKLPGTNFEIPIEKIPLPGKQSNTQESSTSTIDDNHSTSPIDELAKEDIRKSKLIGKYSGCAAGGILTYVLGHNMSQEMRVLASGAGCIVGGAVGQQIGNAVGEKAANRRKEYASEHEFLESEIAASKRAIQTRENDIAANETEITAIKQEIAALGEKESLTKKEQKRAKEIKDELEEKIDQQNILSAQYQEKIAYLDNALETSKLKNDATEEEKKLWQAKHNSLEEKRDKLLTQKAAFDSQREILASEKTLIESILKG